jgi:hypothetical protein
MDLDGFGFRWGCTGLGPLECVPVLGRLVNPPERDRILTVWLAAPVEGATVHCLSGRLACGRWNDLPILTSLSLFGIVRAIPVPPLVSLGAPFSD